MTTLDTLRQLLAAATPGPWSADWGGSEPCVVGLISYTKIDGYVDPEGRKADIAQRAADRAVAAAAPTHLADLITALDLIERVRDLHKRVEIQGSDGFGGLKTIGYECDYCGPANDITLVYPCPTIRILDGNE